MCHFYITTDYSTVLTLTKNREYPARGLACISRSLPACNLQGQDGASGEKAFSSAMASLAEDLARSNVEGAEDPLAKTLADLSKNLSSDAEKVWAFSV